MINCIYAKLQEDVVQNYYLCMYIVVNYWDVAFKQEFVMATPNFYVLVTTLDL